MQEEPHSHYEAQSPPSDWQHQGYTQTSYGTTGQYFAVVAGFDSSEALAIGGE